MGWTRCKKTVNFSNICNLEYPFASKYLNIKLHPSMKLTALLYSLFIFISCANNTGKKEEEKQKGNDAKEPMLIVLENDQIPQNNTALENVVEEEKNTYRDTLETTINIAPEVKEAIEKKESQTRGNTPITEVGSIENTEPEVTNTVDLSTEITQKVPKETTVLKVQPHDAWDGLLRKYVDNTGNVDYSAFKNSIGELSAYLDALAKNSPKANWSKNEKLAYYINIYNAATVKLILDNYPTKSIKDIKKPWGKDIVQIGDDLVSLGYIEHKVLRKMNEPRIHFAINCASYSCPKLVNKAFTASAMERQLEAATKDFVNDTTRNQFSAEEAKLSEIFKWYKGDFTDNGSLKEYINGYLNTPMTAATKIKYLKYDWNLNEK